MNSCRRLLPPFLTVLLAMSLPGCGAVIVTKTVTGAGSLVVGGAVGAVKVTGKAVGATAGAVTGLGRDSDDEAE